MNECNDINKDLKDFVKHILEGKYDDEFIKIYRNSYYDKTSNDITLRESDMLSPLCQKLIKTDILIAILNFQGKIINGKIKIEDNIFINFKNETLEKSIKLRNIAEERVHIEQNDFYYDFVHIGLSNFYKIEDYINGDLNEDGFVENLLNEVNKYKVEVDSWLDDYIEGTYKHNLGVRDKIMLIRRNINRLSKKIEYVEVNKIFEDLTKMDKNHFVNQVGNTAKKILTMIEKYNLDIIDYVDRFMDVVKNLSFDDYKDENYRTIVGLKNIFESNVFKRRVSNEIGEVFINDIVLALARKIAKTEQESDERKEINQYYLTHITRDIKDKIDDEVLMFEYEQGISYKNSNFLIYKIETIMKKKLLEKIFEKSEKRNMKMIDILFMVPKKIDFFDCEIIDIDTVKISMTSESPYLLNYTIIDIIETIRCYNDINISSVIDVLEDYKLKAKLFKKPDSDEQVRAKVKI